MGDKLRYWVGFNLVYGIGAVRIQRLLDVFGDLEQAWHAPVEELRKAGIGSRALESLLRIRATADLDDELGRLKDNGVRVITIADDDYPARLREIDQSPPLIFSRGEIIERDQWAVGVVGTRSPSVYGRSVAEEICSTLAQQGLTIVSGLARGIDAISHRAALQAGGRTIAVLGSGLGRIYPPEHHKLAREIVQRGAVISEYALDTPPEGRNFPPRNRIISGLSLGVVVVEAGRTSGALITADFAADQGRDVFAVPGDITRKQSVGTNHLIQQGAVPVTDPLEIMEVLNLALVDQERQLELAMPDNPAERKLLEALGREPLHVDEISARCGLSASEVSAGLAMLEIKQRVRQVGGMQFVRIREGQVEYSVD